MEYCKFFFRAEFTFELNWPILCFSSFFLYSSRVLKKAYWFFSSKEDRKNSRSFNIRFIFLYFNFHLLSRFPNCASMFQLIAFIRWLFSWNCWKYVGSQRRYKLVNEQSRLPWTLHEAGSLVNIKAFREASWLINSPTPNGKTFGRKLDVLQNSRVRLCYFSLFDFF